MAIRKAEKRWVSEFIHWGQQVWWPGCTSAVEHKTESLRDSFSLGLISRKLAFWLLLKSSKCHIESGSGELPSNSYFAASNFALCHSRSTPDIAFQLCKINQGFFFRLWLLAFVLSTHKVDTRSITWASQMHVVKKVVSVFSFIWHASFIYFLSLYTL